MKKSLTLILALSILLGSHIPARADGGGAEIVIATKQISDETRTSLLDFLNTSPPVNATKYAITYASTSGSTTYVSLVALSDDVVPAEWSLEDAENTLWMGTVVLDDRQQSPEYLKPPETRKAASPSNAGAGGGPDIAFPWESQKAVLYGPRGVHGEGDYGTSGMYAIDAVVGNDYGTNIAHAFVYASYAGSINWICEDDTQVVIRTDDGAGNVFVYGHLIANEDHVIGHEYDKGDLMGGMVFGKFGDFCGWAKQKDNHAHVHWMFNPENGYFQAEDCVIEIGSQNIVCGVKSIAPTGFILGGGGDGTGIDTDGDGDVDGDDDNYGDGNDGGDDDSGTVDDIIDNAQAGDMSFFDYILVGGFSLFEKTILAIFPSYDEDNVEFFYIVDHAAVVVFRIAYVMMVNSIDLSIFMLVLGFLLWLWLLRALADIVLEIIRVVAMIIK